MRKPFSMQIPFFMTKIPASLRTAACSVDAALRHWAHATLCALNWTITTLSTATDLSGILQTLIFPHLFSSGSHACKHPHTNTRYPLERTKARTREIHFNQTAVLINACQKYFQLNLPAWHTATYLHKLLRSDNQSGQALTANALIITAITSRTN